MEGIVSFWKVQPDIVRDFLRILLLLLLASLARSIFPLVRVLLGGIPRSLVSAFRGTVEAPAAAYANLQSAEEGFAKLRESTVGDVKLLRFICSVTIVLSLTMIWFSASAVYEDLARITRLEGGYTLHCAIRLLELLGFGLTHCAILYAVTNALEYLLQRREIEWRRFLEDAKRALAVAKI